MEKVYEDSTYFDEIRDLNSKSRHAKVFLIIFSLLIVVIAIFVFDGIDYYDPSNSCYLSIKKDPFYGDKGKILSAIKLLKSRDGNTYERLCSNIRYIWERRCIAPEDMSEPNYKYTETGGCYFKGSNIIFIETRSKEMSTQEIADSIYKVVEKIDQ